LPGLRGRRGDESDIYPDSGRSTASQPTGVHAHSGTDRKTFSRHTLRKRFRTACKVLGPSRLEMLTIHHGRHTFISHALAGRRTLAEVRDAAGHANVSITSGYLHVAVDDETRVGNLFNKS
jgi:integrase